MATPYDNPPSTHWPAAREDCLWCGKTFLPADAVDDTGTLHIEPCLGEWRIAEDDRAYDRMKDNQAMYAVRGGSPLGAVKP